MCRKFRSSVFFVYNSSYSNKNCCSLCSEWIPSMPITPVLSHNHVCET
jgi:hypothetical protein